MSAAPVDKAGASVPVSEDRLRVESPTASARPTVALPSEQGPRVHLQPVWIFELCKRDSLLMLRSLGGRLTTDEETEAARLLGNRLTQQRSALAQDLATGLSIAAAAAAADMQARSPS